MSPSKRESCANEIKDLLSKGLIEPSKSLWACRAFVVNKLSEIKRGKPRLVVNYKLLNAVIQKIRYFLLDKFSLLQRIAGCTIFSKFDLKSGFYQIGIEAKDRFKTAFVMPHGQYQWKVLPFGINNAPFEFRKRMEDIFREKGWALVYINDILICSKNLQEHLNHLQEFYHLVYKHGLVLCKSKMEIGKIEIEFLGFKIDKGQVILQDHVLKVFSNFPDQILEKVQLQRFLGSLNYIQPFYKGQAEDNHVLQQRLEKNPPKWSKEMTAAVQKIKGKVKQLPAHSLPQETSELIVETHASSNAWGGVLIEKLEEKEEIRGYA